MFGKSLLIDMYDCATRAVDDLEVAYTYLETLVDVLGMTKQSPPFVIHAPKKDGVDLYPDKVGISAWIPLIESGIQIHTIKPKNFISIDIFTCGELDVDLIIKHTKNFYAPLSLDWKVIDRGDKFDMLDVI